MKVRILLSEHFDLLSRFVFFITGRKYTHASIQLNENSDTYYSFNKKGFRFEKPLKWKKRDNRINGKIYEVEISKKQHKRMKNFITSVINHQTDYEYNLRGLLLRMVHISFSHKYSFFCSEFVAEALMRSGIIPAGKPAAYYYPNTLEEALLKNRKICRTMKLN